MVEDVQVMVATKAFGLGINKPNIRHVIRNGVPESISCWLQESGRTGRDGLLSTAHIFYEESDIDHAGAWIREHLLSAELPDNILQKCPESWKFIYAGIAGQCRRQVMLEAFGETDVNVVNAVMSVMRR